MELETLAGYLVALAVPVWLLVEGVAVSRRSLKQTQDRVELRKVSGKRASGAPATITHARAMQVADAGKTV